MNHIELGEVAQIERKVASEEDCEILPYVGLEHIEKDTGSFVEGFRKKPEELLAAKFRFNERHILYGKLRPYLNKVTMPTFEGVCTTEILPIRPIDGKLYRTYLWAYLLSKNFVDWASLNVSGAQLPRISPKKLKEHLIPYTPLPEQKRIAAILEKADRLRRLRRYARKLSDIFLQSVFLEMFGDPLSNPMGFPTSKIRDITRKVEKIIPSDKPEKEIQYIDITSVDSRYGEITSWKSMLGRDAPSRARQLVKHGDILISTVRPNLRATALIGADFSEFICSTGFCVLRPSNRVISEYLFGITRQLNFSEWLAGIAKGASYPAVTDWDINQISIPIPQKQLQVNYAETSARFSRLRIQQLESERQMEHLFQSLLHRAFRGEL